MRIFKINFKKYINMKHFFIKYEISFFNIYDIKNSSFIKILFKREIKTN